MDLKLIKSQKGISGLDIGIAVVVIVLFVSIITTLYYQIYRVTTETKRNAEATAHVSSIIENIKNLDYESVVKVNSNNDNKISNILKKLGAKDVTTENNKYKATIGGYTIRVGVESYKNDIKRSPNFKDILKRITVSAEYNVNKETKTLEVKTLITK